MVPLRRLRRATVTAAPPLGDALLASVFVVATLAEAVVSDSVPSPALHAFVAGPAMAALAWRRRLPLGVAVTVVAVNFVVNPDGQLSTLLALVLAAFTVGSEVDPPRAWIGLGLLTVPFLAVMTYQGLEPSDFAAAAVFLVGPWLVGAALRQRSIRAAEAVDRAAQLERRRDEDLAAVAAHERLRIARELHDVVSHSISVVAIQTQAVRRRLAPGQEREAADLAAVETTARQALAEMRRIFGALRSDDESPALTPQPGLAELGRLAEQVRAAGLPVDLSISGEPTELPPGVDLAAYRIVQEGLTNALRHASARRTQVHVRHTPTAVQVTVDDDGCGPSGQDAGHGLVGIRERVALYGGTMVFGPGPVAGSRLAATLPVREVR